ncbi:YlzJ-like family protein [Bacillus solimangrovi]|uniref:Uncharacterized protein n=1 Tax=Bacillus solimangrovi TaxID=1305675 RepID=A0A1E5LJ82_9BACI|nr:YlzJ-like family protein [Bacillus solimangrovi]OEH94152.1 hypothetical protein BFG57_09915 [Bacillus solimangrovi]
MIHYTTLPLELIFPAENQDYMNQTVISHNGVQMVVEQVSVSQCRIVRLLSSNPNDYLNQKYMPGTMMNMTVEM